MRILVINYEYPPIGGGGGFVTRDILEEIASKGHKVAVVTSHKDGLERDEVVNGVQVMRVPVLMRKKDQVASISSMLSYLPSSLFSIMKLIQRERFDIINTHFAIPSGPTGYLISKRYNIPNVLSIHGGDIFDPSKPYSPHKTPVLMQTVRTVINGANRIVAQSNNTKNNAIKYYGIKRKIEIIPLGIKKPNFIKIDRKYLKLEENDFIFCTIGRLVRRKNIQDTLKVLNRLKNKLNFKFLVIGDGPERGALENSIDQYDIRKYVKFLGNVSNEEKFQILNISDAYLSTALHEGFGLVFLEAMEFGLPIICHDNGGQTDFLTNGDTGFLTGVGDLSSFEKNVLRIYNDKALRDHIRVNNKKLIKNFYIHRCAEQYLNLFNEVLYN
jgi:glycosyltransferase involved in cell wall biosynthesis